jgi:hypothetical protein
MWQSDYIVNRLTYSRNQQDFCLVEIKMQNHDKPLPMLLLPSKLNSFLQYQALITEFLEDD